MKLMVDLPLEPPPEKIAYSDPVLLTGSCFTEHVGNMLAERKFRVMLNPNGILFDPAAVATSILSWLENRELLPEDLFQLNGLWHSWAFHSRFSQVDREAALDAMNGSIREAHRFLGSARWLFITLGSAHVYRLATTGQPVANCHKAPGTWFTRHLMTIDEMVSQLDFVLHRLFRFRPELRVVFTVSPVRHIRDGVIQNNRSKARLLETVHHLVNKYDALYYFPSYEMVIDVLRDYRFYDVDLVHPNYQATSYVMDRFLEYFLSEPDRLLARELQQLAFARKHRPLHPESEAHRQFLQKHAEMAASLMKAHSFLDLREEYAYFSGAGK